MKILTLALTGLLIGCGTVTPLEELEREALLTGNWSAVERRQQILEQRKLRRSPSCPAGYVAYCIEEFGRSNCSCITRASLRSAFR